MKNRKFIFLYVLMSLSTVYASGFRNYEHGAKATSLAGAFIARADDPSAIFYNPAGISFATSNTFSVGTTLINPMSSFTGPAILDKNIYSETKSNIYTPSSFYMVFPVFKNINFGFGLYSPFSSGVEWSENWVGRFLATNSEFKSLSVNPVLSWKPYEFISVGAGIDLMYGAFIYEKAVVFTPRELNGIEKLSGDAYGLGFTAGVQIEPLSGLKLGATYRSSRKLDFKDAERSFNFPRTDDNYTNAEIAFVYQSMNATTNFSLPAEYGFGISYKFFDKLTIEADQVFTDWEIFDVYLVHFDIEGAENAPLTFMRFFQNTQSQRFGLEYQIFSNLALRSGMAFETSAVKDFYLDPTLPEARRKMYSFGLGYNFSLEDLIQFKLDLAYQFTDQDKRSVLGTQHNFNGTYLSLSNSYAISLSWAF